MIFLMAVSNLADGREFDIGQVWTYKTRPGEEQSVLQINKVENVEKLGRIYHISVFHLHVSVPGAPEGFVSELPHLPVSQKSLDDSVLLLSKEPAQDVDFEEGYREWTEASGGVFTMPVAEVVDVVETTVSGVPRSNGH